MWQELGAAGVATLQRRSQDHVRASLAKFAGQRQPPWLRVDHPYRNGQLPRGTLVDDVPAADLAEMVSVSGPLHCSDGWGYLARALNALLAGDAHACRHLAYYAELRAALSLLASDGIGIFDGRNFVIDNAGSAHAFLGKRGTHEFTWAVLKEWAQQPETFERVASSVEVAGVSLMDGLQTFFPSSRGTTLGSSLIEAWGYDLMVGVSDREQRNYSSYVGTDLTPIATVPSDDIAFIDALWRSFEPGSWSLERYLLRHLLQLEIRAAGAIPLSARKVAYDRMDPRLQNAVSFSFLANHERTDNHPLLLKASDLTGSDPTPMLARSALLLRIATGMARQNLVQAGVNAFEDLAPWWSALGLERGFWNAADEPQQMDDLWFPVQDALDAAPAISTADRSSMISSMFQAPSLSQTDRVALWALCA